MQIARIGDGDRDLDEPIAASPLKHRLDSDVTSIPVSVDVEILRRLISDRSFGMAIELLGKGSQRAYNEKSGDGYLLLSLAAKVMPPSNAVLLVGEMINAGVSIYVPVPGYRFMWSKRNDLLVACELGVDPVIFDAILKWHVARGAVRPEWKWWLETVHISCNGWHGPFYLACQSGNYDLVERLLHAIPKEENMRDFLSSKTNSIIEILMQSFRHGENHMIKLVRLCRIFCDVFPVGYTEYGFARDYYDNEAQNTVYNLDKVLGPALNQGMHAFVLEFATLFPSDEVNRILWKWTIWNATATDASSVHVLPPNLRLRAFSYCPSLAEYEAECAKAKKAGFDPQGSYSDL